MEKIFSYLKACDIFAQSPSLGMNQQSVYQSAFGGFTSLTTIFLVFLFFSTNILDYLNGKNIITKQTQAYDNELSNLQLDDQDFMIAFGIEQTDFLFHPYFSINLQQREYQRASNGTLIKNITKLQMVPCTLERFQRVFEKYGKNITNDFNRLNLQNLLCPQSNVSMNIGGTFSTNQFNFLKVEVKTCQSENLSDNKTCATNEELQTYLNKVGSFKIQIFLINKVINPNKIGSDYITVFLDDSSYLSFVPQNLSKYQNIFFRQYQFKNNLDFYPFNNYQNMNFISIDQTETKEITDFGRQSDQTFAAFYFRKSPITIYVERTNQSVTDLLSKLGGLLQISLIVMGFLIAAYNKITMLVELSNKIFEFSLDADESERQHQINIEMINNIYEERQLKQEYYVNKEGQQQFVPTSQIKHKSKIFKLFGKSQVDQHVMLSDRPTENNEPNYINSVEDNDDKSNQIHKADLQNHNLFAQKLKCVSGLDYFKKQINLILNRSKPLQFNMKILLNQLCFRKIFDNNESVQFYNSAVDKINEQLDVFNIITKLNEVNKLKEILLTNAQQLLFDFTSKPIISMVEEKEIVFTRTLLEERARNTFNDTLKRTKKKKAQTLSAVKSFFRTQSLDRDVRIYNKIYRAYDKILQQTEENHPQHEINQKIIKKLGDEIQAIFKLSKLLDFDGIRRLRANSNNVIHCRNTENIPAEIQIN